MMKQNKQENSECRLSIYTEYPFNPTKSPPTPGPTRPEPSPTHFK